VSGVCATCSHAARSAIEAEIAAGVKLSPLERKYHVTRDALRRHRDRHMSGAIVALRAVQQEQAEKQAAAVSVALTAKERVENLVAKLEALVERTDSERRESMLLGASRELRASIELLARLSGELRPENQTTVQVLNLSTSDEWVRTRMAILAALQRHPEALADVANALRLLGDGSPS
jgi:hypothetical protein